MSASLNERYLQLSQRPDFEADPGQLIAMAELEAVAERLNASHQQSAWPRLNNTPPAPLGLWLWGAVGRGKTLLMDLFFESLDEPRKQRSHFHHFMRHLHQRLSKLSGQPEPLALVAAELAGSNKILCFDEFFVSDIGDAMLLGRLFDALFKQGVFLVATSNLHPDQLYQDGLQRQRFLPAIAAIKQHCQIHQMTGPRDHRLRQLHRSELFLDSSDSQTLAVLQQHYRSRCAAQELPLKPQGEHNPALVDTPQLSPLSILGRDIPCLANYQQTAWFSFPALCDGPRSQLDYIALADRFDCLIVSGIPALRCNNDNLWVVQGTEDHPASATNQRRFLGPNDDQCRRFISLIDELYDRSVMLIASCQVGIEQLYPAGPLAFAFERTRSRLLEMQSHEYQQRSRERR
ncbi:MAG: cell division protein ZapE [Motiliproteus sp.]